MKQIFFSCAMLFTLYADSISFYCDIKYQDENEIKTCFYPNHQTKSVRITKNGLKEGVWEFYDSDGSPSMLLSFSHDQFDGFACSFDDRGRVTYLSNYKNGLAEGRHYAFHPNGEIAMSVEYTADEKNGVEMRYDEENHLIESIPYVRGKVHGTHQHYNADGNVNYAFEYRDGEKIRGRYLEKDRWIEVSSMQIQMERLIASIETSLSEYIFDPLIHFMIWLFSPFVLN